MTRERKIDAPKQLKDKELDKASGGTIRGTNNNLKQLATAAKPD